MNARELSRLTWQNLTLFELQDRIYKNCVRINTANSLQHESKKLEVCYKLKEIGHDFLTEATFVKSRKRCDIVDLTGTVYEIAITEAEESLNKKEMVYELPIQIIRANEVIRLK